MTESATAEKPKKIEDLVKDVCAKRDPSELIRAAAAAMELFRHRMQCAVDDAQSREENADSDASLAHQKLERAEAECLRAEDDAMLLAQLAIDAGADPLAILWKLKNERIVARLQRRWLSDGLEALSLSYARPQSPLPPRPKPAPSHGPLLDRAAKLELDR